METDYRYTMYFVWSLIIWFFCHLQKAHYYYKDVSCSQMQEVEKELERLLPGELETCFDQISYLLKTISSKIQLTSIWKSKERKKPKGNRERLSYHIQNDIQFSSLLWRLQIEAIKPFFYWTNNYMYGPDVDDQVSAKYESHRHRSSTWHTQIIMDTNWSGLIWSQF